MMPLSPLEKPSTLIQKMENLTLDLATHILIRINLATPLSLLEKPLNLIQKMKAASG